MKRFWPILSLILLSVSIAGCPSKPAVEPQATPIEMPLATIPPETTTTVSPSPTATPTPTAAPTTAPSGTPSQTAPQLENHDEEDLDNEMPLK